MFLTSYLNKIFAQNKSEKCNRNQLKKYSKSIDSNKSSVEIGVSCNLDFKNYQIACFEIQEEVDENSAQGSYVLDNSDSSTNITGTVITPLLIKLSHMLLNNYLLRHE